jgi:hypothetical protein
MLNTRMRERGSCEPHALDHVEAGESAALHGEIDDHHIGMMAAERR